MATFTLRRPGQRTAAIRVQVVGVGSVRTGPSELDSTSPECRGAWNHNAQAACQREAIAIEVADARALNVDVETRVDFIPPPAVVVGVSHDLRPGQRTAAVCVQVLPTRTVSSRPGVGHAS